MSAVRSATIIACADSITLVPPKLLPDLLGDFP
jgi:hypothetical protein